VKTFVLPDTGWLCLLGPILAESAQAGDVLECWTVEMYNVVVAAVVIAGRDDLVVRLKTGKERAA